MQLFRKNRNNSRRLHMIGDEERKRYMRNRNRHDASQKFLHKIFKPAVYFFSLSLNIVFIILLLLSGLATQISPETFVLPSFLSLGFNFLVIINILYVIFWIIRLKPHFIYSLFVLILLSTNIQNNFPIHLFGTDTEEQIKQVGNNGKDINILSYNVKLFNFYEKDQSGLSKTLEYILKRDADIVCLQEYGFYNNDRFLSEDDIIDYLDDKYPYSHTAYQMNPNGKSSYGIAVFSKFPIIAKGKVNYGSKYNLTTFSDIDADGYIFRLFNCHLESNQFTSDDKKKMFESMSETDRNKITEATDVVTKKLSKASKVRAKQAESISAAIRESYIPVVVCGDLNDTPASYTYKKITGDLSDAFTSTSSGLGTTFNEMPFWFRIDYILHSKNFIAHKFHIDKTELSDHYPISTQLRLTQTE